MKEIIQKVVYNPLSDTEGVLSLTCCIIIFITVIWKIYSLLDEYRSGKLGKLSFEAPPKN